MQAEVYIDYDLYRYWMALIHCRPELILPHGFNSFFVQSHTEMARYTYVLGVTLCIDDQLDRDVSLIIFPASIFCELGLNGVDHLGSTHAATDAHKAAAITASAAWTCSAAMAHTDATAPGLGQILSRRLFLARQA